MDTSLPHTRCSAAGFSGAGGIVGLVAAVFTALTVLGSGTGLVLGKVASVGTEHRHHEATLHEDDGDGPGLFPRGLNEESSR